MVCNFNGLPQVYYLGFFLLFHQYEELNIYLTLQVSCPPSLCTMILGYIASTGALWIIYEFVVSGIKIFSHMQVHVFGGMKDFSNCLNYY